MSLLYFGSDNSVGASAPVMQALQEANAQGALPSYGNDPFTARAVDAVRRVFSRPAEVFFVPTGTAANALALAQLTPRWGSIYCTQEAHIAVDEANAVELQTGGARLVTLPATGGRLLPETLHKSLTEGSADRPHNARPSVLSLTQATEGGLVYSPAEVKALADIARTHRMKVHMDGARFANAIATLGCDPADVTWRAGVDVLTFGASKGGVLQAEAVVFFNPADATDFDYRRKQGGHLVSKSRYMGAQFEAWLQGDHWLELARHANAQALALADGLEKLPGARLPWKPEANEVFCFLARPVH
jgi:threonine aldolase